MALSAVGLKTHIWNNNIKTIVFLLLYPLLITSTYIAVMAALIFVLGYDSSFKTASIWHFFQIVVFDFWFVPYGIILSFLFLLLWRNTNRLNLGEGMSIASRTSHPKLYGFLENLCISRGLKTPHLLIKDSEYCNAYTTGLTPGSYCIVVTTKLMEVLDEQEMECVLAHELTHIINGDARLIFLTGTVTHIFRTLSDMFWPFARIHKHDHGSGTAMLLAFLLAAIFKLANIGSLFAQLFISRSREYMADAGAVELTKNPLGLIYALRKVAGSDTGSEDNHIIKASLFHYRSFGEILTHPPVKDRIAAISHYNGVGIPQATNPAQSPWKRKAIKQAKAAYKEVQW